MQARKATGLHAVIKNKTGLCVLFPVYVGESDFYGDVIAVSRGIVVKALAFFLIPAVLGDGYVWCSVAAAEVVTLVVCLILNYCQKSG